jgi:hypothetical protein
MRTRLFQWIQNENNLANITAKYQSAEKQRNELMQWMLTEK